VIRRKAMLGSATAACRERRAGRPLGPPAGRWRFGAASCAGRAFDADPWVAHGTARSPFPTTACGGFVVCTGKVPWLQPWPVNCKICYSNDLSGIPSLALRASVVVSRSRLPHTANPALSVEPAA
jgi:hypothetical protein